MILRAKGIVEAIDGHWIHFDYVPEEQDVRTGGAAVIHVGGDREGHIGVFSHGGHYVAAISEDRDGRIVILDPSFFEGKYEEEGRKGLVEMKNRVIALCDMQVLIDDTANREPHYHLFWRK